MSDSHLNRPKAPYVSVEDKYFGSRRPGTSSVFSSKTADSVICVDHEGPSAPNTVVKPQDIDMLRRPVTASLLVSSTGSWKRPSSTIAAPAKLAGVQPQARWESSQSVNSPAHNSLVNAIGVRLTGSRRPLSLTTTLVPDSSKRNQPQPHSSLHTGADSRLNVNGDASELYQTAEKKPNSARTSQLPDIFRANQVTSKDAVDRRGPTENTNGALTARSNPPDSDGPISTAINLPLSGEFVILASRTSAQLQRAITSRGKTRIGSSSSLTSTLGAKDGEEMDTVASLMSEALGGNNSAGEKVTNAKTQQYFSSSSRVEESAEENAEIQASELAKQAKQGEIFKLSDLLMPFSRLHRNTAHPKGQNRPYETMAQALLNSATAHKSFAAKVAENALLLLEVLNGRKTTSQRKSSVVGNDRPNDIEFDLNKERKELLALGSVAFGLRSNRGSLVPQNRNLLEQGKLTSPNIGDSTLDFVNNAFDVIKRVDPDLWRSGDISEAQLASEQSPSNAYGQTLVEAWLAEMSSRRIAEHALAEGLSSSNSPATFVQNATGHDLKENGNEASNASKVLVADTMGQGLMSNNTVMLAPADQIGIGRRALTESGLSLKQVDAVSRGLFVFTVGIASALKRLIQSAPRAPALFRAIWQTYARLIACSDPSFFAWLSKCLVAENQRRVSARAAEYASALASLRTSVAERAQRCAAEHAALYAASRALRRNRVRVAQARRALLQDRDGYEALVDKNGSLRGEVTELRAAASARILAAAELRTLLSALAAQYQRSRNSLKRLQESHSLEKNRFNEAHELHSNLSREQSETMTTTERLELDVRQLEHEAGIQTEELKRVRQALEKELGTQRSLAEQLIQEELTVLRLIDGIREALISPEVAEEDRNVIESRIARVKLEHAKFAALPLPIELLPKDDESDDEQSKLVNLEVIEDLVEAELNVSPHEATFSSKSLILYGSDTSEGLSAHASLSNAFSSEFRRRAIRMRAAHLRRQREIVENQMNLNTVQLSGLDERISALKQQFEDVESQHSEALRELYQEEEKLDRWNREVEVLSSQHQRWADQLTSGEDQLQQNELTQLAAVERRRAEAEAIVEELQNKLKELEEISEDLEVQRARVHAELQDALVRRMQLEARHEQEIRLTEELSLRGAQEMEQLQRRLAAALKASVQARKQKYDILKEYKSVRERILDADETIQSLTTQVEDSIVDRETRKTQAELTRKSLDAIRKKLREVEEQVINEETRAQAAAESYARRTQELHELLTTLSRRKAEEEQLFQEAKVNFIESDRKLGNLQHAYELEVRNYATQISQLTAERDLERNRYNDFRQRADTEAEIIHRTCSAAKRRHGDAKKLNEELLKRNKELLKATSTMRAELSRLNETHDMLQRQVDDVEEIVANEKGELNARVENERGMLRECGELMALANRHENANSRLRSVHAEVQQQNASLEAARWRVSGSRVRKGIQVEVEMQSIGVQAGPPLNPSLGKATSPTSSPSKTFAEASTTTETLGVIGKGTVALTSQSDHPKMQNVLSQNVDTLGQKLSSSAARQLMNKMVVKPKRQNQKGISDRNQSTEMTTPPLPDPQVASARDATATITEAIRNARLRKAKEIEEREARMKRLEVERLRKLYADNAPANTDEMNSPTLAPTLSRVENVSSAVDVKQSEGHVTAESESSKDVSIKTLNEESILTTQENGESITTDMPDFDVKHDRQVSSPLIAAPDRDVITGVHIWEEESLHSPEIQLRSLSSGVKIFNAARVSDGKLSGQASLDGGLNIYERPRRSLFSKIMSSDTPLQRNESDYALPDLQLEDDQLTPLEEINVTDDSLDTLLRKTHRVITLESAPVTEPKVKIDKASPTLSPSDRKGQKRLRPSASVFSTYKQSDEATSPGASPLSQLSLRKLITNPDKEGRLPSVHESDEVRVLTGLLDSIANDSPSNGKVVSPIPHLFVTSGSGGSSGGGGEGEAADVTLEGDEGSPVPLVFHNLPQSNVDSKQISHEPLRIFTQVSAQMQAELAAQKSKREAMRNHLKARLIKQIRDKLAHILPQHGLSQAMNIASLDKNSLYQQSKLNPLGSSKVVFEDSGSSFRNMPFGPTSDEDVLTLLGNAAADSSLDLHLDIIVEELGDMDPSQIDEMELEDIGLDEERIADLCDLVAHNVKKSSTALMTSSKDNEAGLQKTGTLDDRAVVRDTLISRAQNQSLLRGLEHSTRLLKSTRERAEKNISSLRRKILVDLERGTHAAADLDIDILSPAGKFTQESHEKRMKNEVKQALGLSMNELNELDDLRSRLADADSSSVIKFTKNDEYGIQDSISPSYSGVETVTDAGTAILTPRAGAAQIRLGLLNPTLSPRRAASKSNIERQNGMSTFDRLVDGFDASGTKSLLSRLKRRALLSDTKQVKTTIDPDKLDQSGKALRSAGKAKFANRMKTLIKRIHSQGVSPAVDLKDNEIIDSDIETPREEWDQYDNDQDYLNESAIC